MGAASWFETRCHSASKTRVNALMAALLTMRLASPLYAEPLHKPRADLHRVAIGGADAWLVVDAGGDEARAALRQRRGEQALELFLVRRPGTLGEARRARNRHEVGR